MKRRFQTALFDHQSGRMKNSMIIDVLKNIIEDCFHQIKLLTRQNDDLQNHNFRLHEEIAKKDDRLCEINSEIEMLYGELKEKSSKIDEEMPKLKRQIEIEKQNSRNAKRQHKHIINELQRNQFQTADCNNHTDDDRIKEYELLLNEKNEKVEDLVQVTDKTVTLMLLTSLRCWWPINCWDQHLEIITIIKSQTQRINACF